MAQGRTGTLGAGADVAKGERPLAGGVEADGSVGALAAAGEVGIPREGTPLAAPGAIGAGWKGEAVGSGKPSVGTGRAREAAGGWPRAT